MQILNQKSAHIKLMLLFLSILSLSCSTLRLNPYNSTTEQTDIAESEVVSAQELLFIAEYSQAQERFESTLRKFPQTSYKGQIQLGIAQCLDGQEKFSEAQSIYRQVYTTYVGTNNVLTAQALYLVSSSYEQSGDYLKALASLHDAKHYVTFLMDPSAPAEIAARLAHIYEQLQQPQEAKKYLIEAEREMRRLAMSAQNRPSESSKQWLAKTYFQMGRISTTQLSFENLSSTIRAQKLVQNYLLQSMILNDTVWSRKAQQRLITNYRDLWQVILAFPQISGIDPSTSMRIIRQEQVSKASELMELIDEAEQHRPLEEFFDTKKNDNPFLFTKIFYEFLDQLKIQVQAKLYESEESTILSEESTKRNQIKRNAKIPEDIFLQKMKNEDPNL